MDRIQGLGFGTKSLAFRVQGVLEPWMSFFFVDYVMSHKIVGYSPKEGN